MPFPSNTAQQGRRQWLLSCGLFVAGTHASVRAGPVALRLLAGHVPPLSQAQGGRLNACVAGIALAAGYTAPALHLPWPRAVRDAREGGHALIYPMARTPEREAQWQWLAQLATDEAVLLVRRDAMPDERGLSDPRALQGLRIGTLRDSVHVHRLQAEGVTQLDYGPTEEANARKLGAGRIQAWAVARNVANYLLDMEHIDRSQLHPPIRRGTLPLYLAATLDLSPQVLRPWKAGLPGALSVMAG